MFDEEGVIFPTTILLATDGSRESAVAEEAAVGLANGTASELHVVHVVSPVAPDLPYPGPLHRNETVADLRKLRGLALLDDRLRRIEKLGGAITATHYREGEPEKEVLRLAEQLEAGLIVTGGRRRAWFERILGAGFSERLFRRADRPVLVVGGKGLMNTTVAG